VSIASIAQAHPAARIQLARKFPIRRADPFDITLCSICYAVPITEADDTPLAKRADVCVPIPRGRPGQMALHGATLVALEAFVLSLATANPDAALASLDNLNRFRRATEAKGTR
jgi:hypothetical protein